MEAIEAKGLVTLMIVGGEHQVVLLRIDQGRLERTITEGFNAIGVDAVVTGVNGFAITLVGSMAALEEDDVVLTVSITDVHGITNGSAIDVVDSVCLGGEFLTNGESSNARSDRIFHFEFSLMIDYFQFDSYNIKTYKTKLVKKLKNLLT